MSFNKYQDVDFVAHYTRAEACLGILHSKKLWLTPKKETTDLLERRLAKKTSVMIHSESRASIERSYFEDSSKASLEIAKIYRCIRQTSFCKTKPPKKIGFSEHFDIDYCCFMHQRMWEQYASNYEGFCLIFSLSSLKANNPSVLFKDIKYVGIGHLNQIVNQDYLDADCYHNDKANYMVEARNKAIDISLYKTCDYQEENEVRALSISTEDNNKHLEMNIGDSLKAIAFFPNNSNTYTLNLIQAKVKEIANDMGIEILYMNEDSLYPVSQQEYNERIREVKEAVKKAREQIEQSNTV